MPDATPTAKLAPPDQVVTFVTEKPSPVIDRTSPSWIPLPKMVTDS
jgi:hypothetical protein